MKKIQLFALFSFSILVFSQSTNAAVTSDCQSAWYSSSTSWYNDCLLWIQSEPEVVGVTTVEVHNNTYGTVFQGGSQIASPSQNAYAYDSINLTQVSPGVYVMSANANARLYAYKYDSNNDGVTWNTMCAKGRFSAYQLGTGWIYVPELDALDCIPSPVSTE